MSTALGHHAPRLLVGLLGGLIALTVVPGVAPYVPWPVLLVALGVAVVLGLSILAHNRRLCARCIAALPLDASAVADRYALRFRVAHLFESKLFALGYLAVVLGSSLMYAHPVGRYAWAAVEASLMYLLVVYVTHQRLQPWCPYCRNGGDEQVTPTTPTPVSTHV